MDISFIYHHIFLFSIILNQSEVCLYLLASEYRDVNIFPTVRRSIVSGNPLNIWRHQRVSHGSDNAEKLRILSRNHEIDNFFTFNRRNIVYDHPPPNSETYFSQIWPLYTLKPFNIRCSRHKAFIDFASATSVKYIGLHRIR